MSGHERERLSAYLDGELAPAERAAVGAHLAECPECTAFLAALAAAGEAAAALPAEAPEGYFDTFPARVRARLQPRKAAAPPRRVPAWTWAAAAALLLAVITPLALRHSRPAAYEARPSAPVAAQPAPGKAEPDLRLSLPEPQPTPAPATSSRTRPTPPVALSRPAQPMAVAPPVAKSAPQQAKDRAAEGAFAPEPAAPPRPAEFGLARQEAAADAESERAAGGVVSPNAANREKQARVAPRSAATAEAASPALAAASAGREATPASLKAQEEAFRRLEAVRPGTAAGWRRLREQWNALAAAEMDPARADEARVRAIVAAREAWQAGGDEGDEAVFRAEAESYLRRDDARQKPRVERLLAEP